MSADRTGVVLITTASVWGGVLKHVTDLALALEGAGVQVTVAAPLDPGLLTDRGLDLAIVPVSAATAAASHAEIVHIHLSDTLDPRAARLIRDARRAGARVVVTEHAPRTWVSDVTLQVPRGFVGRVRSRAAAWAKFARKRWQLRGVQRLIAVSRSDATFLTSRWRLDECRIAVVHNGIAPPTATARETERGLIVAVGSVVHHKGHDVLIEAARVASEPWQATVLGEGAHRQRLSALAAQLPGPAGVQFVGNVADVDAWLTRAEVFVMPSRWEAFGYSALEAMTRGIPVVLSSVGGLTELVRDDADGVLVTPDDPVGLAAAIDRLVASAHERARLGAAAAIRAKEFTIGRMLDGTLEVYRTVLGPQIGPGPASRPQGAQGTDQC